jgi:hypothetical protein
MKKLYAIRDLRTGGYYRHRCDLRSKDGLAGTIEVLHDIDKQWRFAMLETERLVWLPDGD